MPITKELLKQEIDYIQDQYVDALYMIIKAFEYPSPPSVPPDTEAEWRTFLETFAGICADAPLERGEQGRNEVREPLL